MADDDISGQPSAKPISNLLKLAEAFSVITSTIDQAQSDPVVSGAFVQAIELCEQARAEESSTETRHLLANVQTALETWRHVWPRLKHQEEFRLAVAREARLWAQQFERFTKQS